MNLRHYLKANHFVLVHQGGHHDVYCNKKKHIWTTGGFVGLRPMSEKRRGACDCHKYRAAE